MGWSPDRPLRSQHRAGADRHQEDPRLYSTISRLGYMFLGLGVGAYAAGIFHLLAQGFFKALLFLGAGSVIHALAGEQNIDRMGGLARRLRLTSTTFLPGALAMAGVPPFSGFFRKDAILVRVFERGNTFLWLLGTATAFVTAFYAHLLLRR